MLSGEFDSSILAEVCKELGLVGVTCAAFTTATGAQPDMTLQSIMVLRDPVARAIAQVPSKNC